MVKVAAAIESRTARTKRAIDHLKERQTQIDRVHDAVLNMDAKSAAVLLALYYPRQTYAQAAEALGVETSTVSRQRKAAVDSLIRRIVRLHGGMK